MEVHHHSNTSPKEKHFRHYLFEFLMLFLAVFCGFMAENWREHIVEHRREKKFMQSLVSDLAADTIRLTEIIQQRQHRDIMLDSFIILLNRPDAVSFSRYLYYFNSFATRSAFRFTPNDGTMQQLKNAGNLRLIRKAEISDSIVAYDVISRAYVWLNNDEEEIMHTYRNIAEGVFDGRVLNAMRSADNATVMMPDYDPTIRLSADAVFRLTYRIHMLTVFNKSLRHQSIEMKQEAVNLLVLIKKEYYLK